MIKKIYKKYEIIFNVIFFSIFPIAAFYLMEFYEHNPFEEVRFMAGFFNIILFELIAWILYFVTGRAKWALRAVFIVAMVFGLINHYVMLFRSTPFVPWDIFSIGDVYKRQTKKDGRQSVRSRCWDTTPVVLGF